MNRSSLVLALGALLGTSCGGTNNPAAAPLNLNRPVDIAFACYGRMRVTHGTAGTADQDVIMTAQPTSSCEIRSQPAATELRPAGQEDLATQVVGTADWYGFILESAQGTVALAHWASQSPSKFMGSAGSEVQVIDADPLTPGKNAISVGEEPIAIATDKSGCYEVTANAGSCDLSVLDINSALAGLRVNSTLGLVNPGEAGAVRVDRIPVKNQMGTVILAKPAAMVAEASTDVVGNECRTVPTTDPAITPRMALAPSGVAYIAYPGCHLVAGIDMSAGTGGTIVAAIRYDAAGVATLLSPAEVQTVTCPVECGVKPDPITSSVSRPVTLAYRSDPHAASPLRLAIGADNSSSLTLVELGPDSLPQSLSQIKLQDPTEKPGVPGTLGVTSIALSAQIAMGGNAGVSTDVGSSGGFGQYIYAVASDNTVRVADVHLDAAHPAPRECDTQVDTRFLHDTPANNSRFNARSIPALQCFAVGDAQTPPRRSGARGPGIELPGHGVPLSVAFVKALPLLDSTSEKPLADTRALSPATLLGTFAIITATNGQAFVVNVDDDDNQGSDLFDAPDPQRTAPVLIMAHQLRDTVSNREQGAETVHMTGDTPAVRSCKLPGGDGAGGPHATNAPLTFTSGGPLDVSKVLELPTIRQVGCDTGVDKDGNGIGDAPPPGIPVSEVMLAATPMVRDQVFPDLRGLSPDENWTLTWEGSLSQDNAVTAIDGPAIREAQMFVDSTASSRIEDRTHPFCSMGVEPFDILQIRGCDPTNQGFDCPLGYSCFVHPDRSVSIGGITIGTCMRTDEAPRLANACRDFLISLRRYTIGHADSGELVLRPRQHVLRTTPLDGCTDDLQCNALADYAEQNASALITALDPTMPKNDKWQCLADDTRAPINADPARNKRCVQRCAFHSRDVDNLDRDLGCDAGSICQGAVAKTDTTPEVLGVCMEGVMPPQACVNAPQRFEVRASEAFTVVGNRSGYIHPFIENPDKTDPNKVNACVVYKTRAANQLQLQIGRIPLKVPACNPMADPISGELPLPGGGFEPNPCSLVTPQVEILPACVDAKTPLSTRDAPAIKFRNRGLTLTLVDPTYPGDSACPLDRRAANPVVASERIPLVFPGYQIAIHQAAGYSPLSLSAVSSQFAPAFPIKVVTGPSESIWVLDDGDFLSTTPGFPSTRGQVYRIEASVLGAINLLQ